MPALTSRSRPTVALADPLEHVASDLPVPQRVGLDESPFEPGRASRVVRRLTAALARQRDGMTGSRFPANGRPSTGCLPSSLRERRTSGPDDAVRRQVLQTACRTTYGQVS
jgi:hypothetical protein